MPHDPKKPDRSGKFTLLAPRGPTNPSPEELTWRVAEVAQSGSITVLGPEPAAGGPPARRESEDAPTS